MNKNGFTLIETTVAMLVMMVVGLSATSLFLYSVRYNSGASQRSTAMAVAQQHLEVLRGVHFGDARLDFGTHTPQTVVISPITSTSYTQGSSSIGGNESDEPPAATASSYSNAFAAAAAAPATPTPTPTGSTAANSTSYRIQTQVDPFPSGVAAAAATQKQITIRVTPINGSGNSSWVNQNAVEIVFRRSMNASGPYKQ